MFTLSQAHTLDDKNIRLDSATIMPCILSPKISFIQGQSDKPFHPLVSLFSFDPLPISQSDRDRPLVASTKATSG